MTESEKVHSNFTRVIIAFFQETVEHQSLRNCGGYLLFFCVTLWHIIQEKFDTRSFFSARAYWYIRCIVWRISSSVVSGWIRQIRRTVRPFSWVVSTQAKPSSIMRREIVRPVAGGYEPLRRIAKFHNGQLRRRYNLPFRLVSKHGLRLLG